METMKTYVDRVLVIFPFEEALYRDAGVNVQFVGHPLVDLAKSRRRAKPFSTSAASGRPRPRWRCCPGAARTRWIDRADHGRGDSADPRRVPDAQFVVACAPKMAGLAVRAARGRRPRRGLCWSRATDDVLAASDVVITASGTATDSKHAAREADGRRLPAVAADVSPREAVRAGGHYAMPNLVAGSRIVPELIQSDFTAERTADEALAPDRSRLYERTRQALAGVRQQLGAPGASARGPGGARGGARLAVQLRGSND